MDDMMSKIQEMLSDEESLKQIQELADMFMNSNSSENQEGEGSGNSNSAGGGGESSDNNGLGIDFGMLMKLGSMMNDKSGDENTAFLLALKPLLKEERRAKVDKAVKLLRLYAVFLMAKESGMLDEFGL